jgi:hypothetical protein
MQLKPGGCPGLETAVPLSFPVVRNWYYHSVVPCRASIPAEAAASCVVRRTVTVSDYRTSTVVA